MVKSNLSELVALGMNETLQNDEFKALFGVTYKTAGEECKECHKDPCKCDDSSADDGSSEEEDSSAADDNAAKDDKDTDKDTEKSDWDDKSAALDVAIEGLLKASAALDSVGFEKSATASLNLAGLIAEAKKKQLTDKEKAKKEKEKAKKEKEKEKRDTQMAKDKAAKEKAKEKAEKEKAKAKAEKEKAAAKAKADKEKADKAKKK